MFRRSQVEIPVDLRARLEVARLDLLALFRALDRMHLAPEQIPQRLIRSYSNSTPIMWNAPRYAGCPGAVAGGWLPFRKTLPSQAQRTLSQLELTIRANLSPAEAYNMVPGRDSQSG
jgi:hypothetical protein